MRGRVRYAVAGVAGSGVLALLSVGVAWRRPRSEERVVGVLTGIEARSLADAGAITLLTADGSSIRLLVDPGVGPHWTPGHLRDHMIAGDPLTVTYRRAGDERVAYRIVSEAEGS